MLLIGDIHCTSSVVEEIIDSLSAFVESHKDEKSIVFLGDYVYHFSYDRKALLTLFRFFLELVGHGKKVYVLAGNHDWISSHFVFSEGQLAIDALLAAKSSKSTGSLQFITQPCVETVDNQTVVFFPYTQLPETEFHVDRFESLHKSSHGQEQWSGRANSLLSSLIDQAYKQNKSEKKIVVFHHWYINNTAFPGQVAKFSFRSPALSEKWLDDDRILLVSGHLHQPFIYKNYCCVGSVWFTSPLETNQIKYLFRLDEGYGLSLSECRVGPYMSIDHHESSHTTIGLTDIDSMLAENRKNAESFLENDNFTLTIKQNTVEYSSIKLTIVTKQKQFKQLDEWCDETVLQTVKSVSIKSKHRMMHELLSSLQDASLSLDSSIADWKVLLERFLQARYGEEKVDEYLAVLQQLKIL